MRSIVFLTTIFISLAIALPDPIPQGYTGPCSVTDCGVNHLDCRNKGNLCVPWPSTDPAKRKGCTCSTG
ncbi:hypothetical protein BDV96DRAFT_495937 [Lophiotrema nucula]|uniref:Uncharacterized protein n=1 Tax=Lophiotrema nucula TaxID=690887 RepID=A0A6A5Z4Z9_9PLEO|nr:hypothetical protein BDV96DRAFT_495937 [Lophiotrema nucula]